MSASVWGVLLPAFAECLVLTGLHAYLGLHVLRRKVVFVDLTLAQIAALGTTVGVLFGLSSASLGAYLLSLSFTFLGAALFALTRMRSSRVPQEAVIGLLYAIAAALAILLVAQAPNGAKQVKDIMTGRLLWVDWSTVGRTAVVYAGLGALHLAFRRQFLLISEDPEEAYRRGMRVWLWDFLFYVSFGVAISLSVRTAGVLLVFVFLVVPAIVALTLSGRLRVQLVIGWVFGTVTTATGLALSWWADLSAGPTVVALYGVLLVPLGAAVHARRAASRGQALRHIGLGTAALAAVALLFFGAGRAMSGTSLAAAHDHARASSHDHAPGHGQTGPERTLQGKADADETVAALLTALARPEEAEAAVGRVASIELLDAAFSSTTDAAQKVVLARRMGALHPAHGVARLVSVVESEAAPFEKSEAIAALGSLCGGRDFGLDPEGDAAANAAALAAVRQWLETLPPATAKPSP